MKTTYYILLVHLTKATFLTKYQIKYLVKIDKCTSKWPLLNQISRIEWIGFSQFDHLDLTFSQIDHTHLMT